MPPRWNAILYVAAILFGIILPIEAEVKDLPREGFEFFEKNIRPVLVEKCYKCHSTEAEKSKGGLLLDSKAAILKGGSSGVILTPFKPEESLLLKAIRHVDPDLQMPPKEKLSAFDIKNFEIWIKMGAPDSRTQTADAKTDNKWTVEESKNFWSFRPVKRELPPLVKDKKWPKTPIDQFILAKLEEKLLKPKSPADKRTLIRRATYDLTGLPPTPEEIDAFLQDKFPDAFEKVIERLLASPRYGEQWGRHWLDVVRYADTSGCNSDYPIPSAYKYRNYVIQSFNRDKPYDQFVREQIAGDLLPGETDEERFEKIIATGYLAISRRFGSRNNEFHLTIEDTIDNFGKGVLGLSTGCARCHDHKFDPIPQKDYYALYGIFSSTKYAFPGTEIYRHPKDFVPLARGEDIEALKTYQSELAALDDEIERLGEEQNALETRLEETDTEEIATLSAEEKAKVESEKKESKSKLNEIKVQIEEARSRQKKLEYNPPKIDKAYAVSEGKAANAKLQKKGSPFQLGEEVPRGFLQILGGQTLPKEEPGSGRLQLAQWLTDRSNPLTARVMVNRIWQYHFGKGIVKTSNDFGTRGEPPTHPELLDYLATEFMDSGWSVKEMHRKIMLSAVYQLSSGSDLHNSTIDPENHLLWRYNRRRLSAEEIRDSMLVISGTLENGMAGEHPFPPENQWKYTQHKPFVDAYETNHRSVYLMQQRIKRYSLFEIWDGADPNSSTGVRSLTTTPIQALMLLNSPFVHDEADKFAVRVGLAKEDDRKRVDYAYRLATGRPAEREEISQAVAYLRKCRSELKNANIADDEQSRAALASYARVLFSSNEFLFVD